MYQRVLNCLDQVKVFANFIALVSLGNLFQFLTFLYTLYYKYINQIDKFINRGYRDGYIPEKVNFRRLLWTGIESYGKNYKQWRSQPTSSPGLFAELGEARNSPGIG